MAAISILWADDEIDLLKPSIQYLEDKGYKVFPVSNGQDALEQIRKTQVDVVFLDESMPGLSGLETLSRIKQINRHLPVIMITKNEEEHLMENAIGSQISDYLIKPVKPQQILSALKKITDNERLVSEKTTSAYQQEFQKLFMRMQDNLDWKEWTDLYKQLVYWESEIFSHKAQGMKEVFTAQKDEANREFCKFISRHYKEWINPASPGAAPVLSHTLLREKLFPMMKEEKPVFLILIDNLRLDQWQAIQPLLNPYFQLEEEDTFFSILPTVTQYSRNAIFSGLLPAKIYEQYPDLWKFDDEEEGKNLSEAKYLEDQLKRFFREPVKHQYVKVTNHHDANLLQDNILNYLNNKLTVVVYNFVDMLSHARTEMEVLKELASDESAYRSLATSWFEHAPLFSALRKLSEKDVNILITTDHGTVRVKDPSKCIGDRSTSTNIRYKSGKNLTFDERDVLHIKKPEEYGLPKSNLSTSYIFAREQKFLCYPNNYNHYVNMFRNTFQHGGISLEEMIVPVARLRSRKR